MPSLLTRIAATCVLLLATGCKQTPDRGPETAVFVEDFGDRSGRPGIARSVSRGLRSRTEGHERLRLVGTPGEADVVLAGTVESATVLPAGRAGANVVVTVTASARGVAADRWLVNPLRISERQSGSLETAIYRVTGRILILTLIALDEFE